jgi:hypothetical protein
MMGRKLFAIGLIVVAGVWIGGCEPKETTQDDIVQATKEMKSDKSQEIPKDKRIPDAIMMGGGK